jgi:hypothetical protein
MFRYVCRDVEPDSVSSNLLLGGGLHFGHQLVYEGLADGGIPPLRQVQDGVVEEILTRRKISPPIKFSNGGDLDQLIAEAQVLTEVMYRSVKPEPVIAVNLEEKVDLADQDGRRMDMQLLVVYDLIVGNGDGETIVDLKAVKQAFSPEKLRWDLQSVAYLTARTISNGGHPVSFRFDVLKKGKTPDFSSHPVTRTPADFARFISIIKGVGKGISSGVYLPNRGCISCSSCGYHESCSRWPG